MISGTYRYVVWRQVEPLIALGWIPCCVLGDYSILMRACECNPNGWTPFHPNPPKKEPIR